MGSSLADASNSQAATQEDRSTKDALYGFDTNFSSLGMRLSGGSLTGLMYAGMREIDVEGSNLPGVATTMLDGADVLSLRQDLNLPDQPSNDGWVLADASQLTKGRSLGGYGPAQRLQPPKGAVDPITLGKQAALDKMVEWGASSPEDSAWRKAMGISYALTDAIVPGGLAETAVAVIGGPIIGKGLAWGGSALNSVASRSALTAWAAEDLGAVASRIGDRLTANWAAPQRLSTEFGGVLLDASGGTEAAGGLGLKPLGPGWQVSTPRGVGAATGPLPDGYQMVSRWAGVDEVPSWLANGGTAVPSGVGAGARVYVTELGAPKPGGTGPIRIDFALPRGALYQASKPEWFQIMQPIQSMPILNLRIHVPQGVVIPKLPL